MESENMQKKVSLLKPYTNFEKIKAMDIDEMAVTLMCPYNKDCDTDDFCSGRNCIDCTREWLESEAEE